VIIYIPGKAFFFASTPIAILFSDLAGIWTCLCVKMLILLLQFIDCIFSADTPEQGRLRLNVASESASLNIFMPKIVNSPGWIFL